MSGIIGHTMYAILAGKAAAGRKLPVAPLIHRHWASYLCGSYLGCDVQTMPEAVCVDTGQEVGYGTAPLTRSPITGGEVKPWSLRMDREEYRPVTIHHLFYGRAHVVFGWYGGEREHTVPWDHLADYAAATVTDAVELFGHGERQLSYLCGWLAHIVGDALIKSVQPGITLHLLNGKYTPANRPIQDLFTFHEIGRRELGLDWANLLADLVATPVEPVQSHYMRVGEPRGKLGELFPEGWAPERSPLLRQVLAENRRYQRIRNPRLLDLYALKQTASGLRCDPQLSRTAGGMHYEDMVALAEKAGFRHALWQMGEAIADLFEQVVERVPALQSLPELAAPTWKDIAARWRRR